MNCAYDLLFVTSLCGYVWHHVCAVHFEQLVQTVLGVCGCGRSIKWIERHELLGIYCATDHIVWLMVSWFPPVLSS